MSAIDDTMQDLVLTVTKATIALDRKDWSTVFDAAKRLQEHGMYLARLADRALISEAGAQCPVTWRYSPSPNARPAPDAQILRCVLPAGHPSEQRHTATPPS